MESYLKSFINFKERTNVRYVKNTYLEMLVRPSGSFVPFTYRIYFCFVFLSRIYLRLKLTEIVVIFIHYVSVMN